MRNIFAATFLTLLGMGVHAQSVSPQVLATSGGYFTSVNAQLSWTLGEPVVDTWSNVSATLTQGFQQNTYTINGMEDLAADVQVTVYPNPSAGIVNLDLNGAHNYVQAYISDAAGQIVGQHNIQGMPKCSFDLGALATGVYNLTILNDQNQKQSITIIKQ